MTPAARIQAAIDLLDQVAAGAAAEKTLTNWARANRYAGAKDRVAIRDHVFEALRCQRSFAALGGATTGRGIMIGALRAVGQTPENLFTGEGYAPSPLTEAERSHQAGDLEELTALDCPDWLAPQLRASLGEDFTPVMQKMRHRAPVFVRVNKTLASVPEAIKSLEQDAIIARPYPLSPTALELVENPRRLRNSSAYKEGLVELQDAASQAIIDHIVLTPETRILDFCAGGGGKALALAGHGAKKIFVHDQNPARMRDLPSRAARANADLCVLDRAGVTANAPYDLVLADVPCSGSGAWRRSPDAKWRLTAEKLDELHAIQYGILEEISGYTPSGGRLAYITCSLLQSENEDQISAFLKHHAEWRLISQKRLTPLDGGDGFFLALLTR